MDFTIVTPSFRQLEWLGLCIASVADQKGVKVEHIIQDAGTAGFAEFKEKMAQQWPEREGYRRVMISEPDQGMYDAVNRGLRRGGAPFCAYLNCDEQYLPGALAKILEAFQQKPAVGVIFGGVLIVGGRGELISARRPARLSLPHVMTCHLPNFTCAMFFRRSLLQSEDAWFDARWRDCADALWVMNRLRVGTPIDRCREFITAFTDTGSNMNLSPNAIQEGKRIRKSAPGHWRGLKIFWVVRHWIGKCLDGAYWPMLIAYSIYTRESVGRRTDFLMQRANPFWISRWFIRERIKHQASS